MKLQFEASSTDLSTIPTNYLLRDINTLNPVTHHKLLRTNYCTYLPEKELKKLRNTVELTKDSFIIDGKRTILRGGALQWFKLPKEVWEDRILRFKAAGYNTIDIYAAWKNHESAEGKFDFKKYDIKHFLELAKKHNMLIVFRPGPYICNEMDSGGLPGWLIAKSDKNIHNTESKDGRVNLRTNEKDFMEAVKKYFSKINEQIKPYLHSNGGPIILYSVENEYDWWQVLQNLDKHSTKNGKPERPINQTTNTKSYLEQLSAFVRADGINIPITTCPGSGKMAGLANAKDLAPIPNMYSGLKNVEYNTVKLIDDMHSDKYEGLYKNVPAGLTETSREANVLRRFVLGGMNSILQFNNIGFFQDGYQNAIIINGIIFDNVKGALESVGKMFDPTKPGTAFLRPSLGFYPGKGDYLGSAIGPSGIFRDSFYNLRRTNMFVQSFEELIAKGYKASRTSDMISLQGQDRRVIIKNHGTGMKDPDSSYANNNYWLHLGGTTALVGIYNDGKQDRILGKDSVNAFGKTFPKYTEMTVPLEYGAPFSTDQNKLDYEYTMLVPVNFPISDTLKLSYSTSEVLSLSKFNDENLLVMYGKNGSHGEFKIEGKNIKINAQTSGITVNEKSDESFTVSYKHGVPQSLSYEDENGKKGRIIVLDTHMAGKTWFVDTKGSKAMISGVDYVNTINNRTALEFSSAEQNNRIIVYSNKPMSISDASTTQAFDKESGISIMKVQKEIPQHLLNIDISHGRIMRDLDEANIYFSTKNWINLGDKPQHLENNGIYHGHSWYRAEFELTKVDLLNKPSLWIDKAGDFEGIYINGKYVSTLVPVGTEINNISKDSGYRFTIPKEILREGKNTVAFKNEIWGHGGILLPQGTLNRISAFGYSFPIPFVKLRIPYVSYDSKKGLSGEARFNDKPITNWKLRPELGGTLKEYHKPSFNDSRWGSCNAPFNLNKGEVLWYRTSFNSYQLPDDNKWYLPLALNLKGKDCKATIYLNGRLIGRWLSDNDMLKRGGWFQPVKNMWSSSSTDEFPISKDALRKGNNILSIAFEDASVADINSPCGKIDEISIKVAKEITIINNNKTQDIATIYKKLYIAN